MVKLVERLRQRKFVFFDAQMMNPHLERFGAYRVEDEEYQLYLNNVATSLFFSSITISGFFIGLKSAIMSLSVYLLFIRDFSAG